MKYVFFIGVYALVGCITNNSYMAKDDSNLISRKVRDVEANDDQKSNRVNSSIDTELTGINKGDRAQIKQDKREYKEAK